MSSAEKPPVTLANSNFKVDDSPVPNTRRDHITSSSSGSDSISTFDTTLNKEFASPNEAAPQSSTPLVEESAEVLGVKRSAENDVVIFKSPENHGETHNGSASSAHYKPSLVNDPGSNPKPTSPTISISSISSSESTTKLIQKLSFDGGVLGDVQNNNTDLSNQSPHLLEGNTKPQAAHTIEQTEQRKPIKFTVRKVSREQLPSRDHTRDIEPPVTRRYGNLTENKAKSNDRKPGDKAAQLKNFQAEYDEHATRIEKIEKEINFLTTLLPPFNVEIDYATRTKITRAIEKLRCKKDEVEKKKYDLGMSISRLWRDFDDNNTWVRSVSKH